MTVSSGGSIRHSSIEGDRGYMSSPGRRVYSCELSFGLLSVVAIGMLMLTAAVANAAFSTSSAKPLPNGIPSPKDLSGVTGTDQGVVSLSADRESRVPGRYIVVLKDSVDHPGSVAAAQSERYDGDLGFVYHSALKGYSVGDLSKGDIEALRNDPRVKYVAPDRKIEADEQKVPASVQRTFAPQNAALDIDGVDDVRVDVDVAVIDTGIDHTHPDLNVVSRVNCVPGDTEEGNFIECVSNSGADGAGHGTHVAGTVGAIDNGEGVVGVAPGARLWSVRVLGNDGTGAESWIVGGIDWVTSQSSSIEVANVSIGGAGPSPSQNTALKASVEKGVVYAVSAGNNGKNTSSQHPANSPDVITVSALADYDGQPGGTGKSTCTNWGPDDTLAGFSNWGSDVEIAAPGVCVYSTLPEGKYGYKNGTSMASPHVAGAAAILASQSNPQTKGDVEAIRQTLIEGGSFAWNDTAADGKPEPLLYLDDEALTQTESATGGAHTVDGLSAILNGATNPRGLSTQYQFEWGTTTEYGNTAPASPKALSSTKYSKVSETIVGLKPEQTYHYRVVATNNSGTSYGADRTLTTSRWIPRTPVSAPPELTSNEWINDISCPSAGSCMAIDWYYYAGNNFMGSYKLSNGQWSFNTMPTPMGSGFPQTYGVSCTSSSACTTVGKHQLSSGVVQPLVERWNGSSWSIQSISPPELSSPYSRLQDVSCISSTECVAVGYYNTPEDAWVSWSARWQNGTWSTLNTPIPSGDSELNGISCTSSTRCVAVGDNGSKRLIMLWDGSSWSFQTPGTASGHLYGVDCTSASFCIAVGNGPTAEIWDGTKWSTQSPPRPSESTWGFLWDISCKSSTYCVGVGDWELGERTFGLVDIWNGSSWVIQPTPHMTEARQQLRGVSCLGLSRCVAIGSTEDDQSRALIMGREDVLAADASSITPATATLSGMVDPGGMSTSYQFEYGPTTSYGDKVPTETEPLGSGAQGVEVTQGLSELSPEKTYHYRLVGSNVEGVVPGIDKTFRSGTPGYQLQFSFGTGQLSGPKGMAIDSSGNIWVADANNDRVQKFNSKGEYLTGFGLSGTGNGQFDEPMDVAITAAGDLWVTDAGNERVQKFDSTGKYLTQFGSEGTQAGKLTYPKGIAIAPNGNIWVSDHLYRRVQEFSATGEFIRAIGDVGHGGGGQTEFLYPDGIAVDGEGIVWVADRNHDKVQKLSSTGQYLGEFGGQGSGDGQLEQPTAIDIKPSGDLVVSDRSNGRVQQFTSSGLFVTKFTGSNEHQGLATTQNGAVYVAQSNGTKVERWQQAVPDPITGLASEITSSGATLAGTVNPRGVATTYRFEYGKTTAYGTKVPVPNESAGSGTTDVAASQAISGLEPSTTYHFRLMATNANGTVYGQDQTFTTPSGIGPKLTAMATTEPFNASSSSLAAFSANWSALGWASGTTPKGENLTTGWRPVSAHPTVNGAYFNPTITDTGSGVAAMVTMGANPSGTEGRHFSLWLDLQSPGGAKAGYELRFSHLGAGNFDVTLSKWQGGIETVLASKSGYSFPNNSSLALADEGEVVSVWTNTGSGLGQLLSASDSAFSGGNAGLSGSGNITRLKNFKVGQLLEPVAGMNDALAALPIRDAFATNENPLSGGGAWAALAWGSHVGRVSSGWGPLNSYPAINGAHWQKASFADSGAGVAVGAKLTAQPNTIGGRYLSVWLNAPSPASARSGYELRLTQLVGSTNFDITLNKWQSGTKTTLATKANYSLPLGSLFALVEKGDTVSVWTKTGTEYTQILSASDSSFINGYTGVEGSGNEGRLKDFRAGPLAPF